jgi:DNA (cytosine-5)-methyltransferase 1
MLAKPILLDTFCKAGGCSKGYSLAGFRVVGVDIEPQPNYLYEFIQAEAVEFIRKRGKEFDAIHASPPCQRYSVTQAIWGKEYPDLVEPVRAALIEAGRPYVIENVIGAPLRNAILLCGIMFGLRVYRHRLFESNCLLLAPQCTGHRARAVQLGRPAKEGDYMTVAGHISSVPMARKAMGIDWMSRKELVQAIPPAYTEYIGKQIIEYVREAAARI